MKQLTNNSYFLSFIAGCLLPLAFAPVSWHGMAVISLAIFFYQLEKFETTQDLTFPDSFRGAMSKFEIDPANTPRGVASNFVKAIMLGFLFGLGYFGVGVSWVIVSIHNYGHLNYLLSTLITLLFIAYLALYTALFGLSVYLTNKVCVTISKPFLFACLWVLCEWLRSTVFTGFPWLLVGFSQIDTPLQNYAPILGTYGLSFLVAFMAGLLVIASQIKSSLRYLPIAMIVIIYLSGFLFNIEWVKKTTKPMTVGVVQANIAMHDKWDSTLFWQLVNHYEQASQQLYDKDVILWPESAIPVSEDLLRPLLKTINEQATQNNSAVILGIPKIANEKQGTYYNALITLGQAQGIYLKKHLVPFGETIPSQWLRSLSQKLNIALPNLVPGKTKQSLVSIKNTPIASLICYEVAFSELLRRQLPQAQWIVTLSDDGWFGHSLAMAQHLEMARMLSLQAGRYQIVANNNGLSSVIDENGHIKAQLKPFITDNLTSKFYPAKGVTPWSKIGDKIIILIIFLIAMAITIASLIYKLATNRR